MSTITKPTEAEELEKLAKLHDAGALTDDEFATAKTEVLEHAAAPTPAPVPGAPEVDRIGAGRYVLSFVLAGLIGLAVAYFLREKGWTAIWVNAVIFVIALVIFVSV